MTSRPNRDAALRLIDRPDPLAGPRPLLAAARRDIVARLDGPAVATIDISGVIDEIAEEKLRRALDAAKGARRLSVRLDSPGGRVSNAFGMFRALREHGGLVSMHVQATCASAACIILASGDVRSAGAASQFLLHGAALPPAVGSGRWTARRHQAQAGVIAKADQAIVDVLADRCSSPQARLVAELETERPLHAGGALGLGLVHYIRNVTTKPDPKIAAWFDGACYGTAGGPFAVCGPFTRPGFLEACRAMGGNR